MSDLAPTLSAEAGNRRGILLLLLAVALFTAMDAVAKDLVGRYPAFQIVWVRFLGQLLVVLAVLGPRLRSAIVTRHPGMHLARSAFQFGATVFFFLSLGHMGLATATAIAAVHPLLITLGAAFFLGEKLTPPRILAVALAAIGTAVIIRPGSDIFTPAAVLPLICAASFAGNALLTRWIGAKESPWASMFYAAVFGTLAAGVTLPFAFTPVPLSDLPAFVGLGLLGAAAQLAMIKAFSVGEASAIAPYSYSDILFATAYGFFLFAEMPDPLTLVGAAVIVVAGLYVWRKERRL